MVTTIILYLLLSPQLISESTVISCILGGDVSFKCPCSRLESCTLTRKSDGLYLVRNGRVNNHNHNNNRYSFDKSSHEFTLKLFHEEDEGTYVWKCGKENYHVEIYERKLCFHGSQVSFKCPCCQKEFESCKFRILRERRYIIRQDAFGVHSHRFKMDMEKAHIILEKCNESDEGTYVWICKTCNVNKTFALKVLKHHLSVDWKFTNEISSGHQYENRSLMHTSLMLGSSYKSTNIINRSSKTLINFPWPYLCLQLIVIAFLKKRVCSKYFKKIA